MNTANKRASAIGIGLALRLVLPVPDATIDEADRQQVAYSYAGVLAGPLIPPPQITHAVDVVLDEASRATDVSLDDASRAVGVRMDAAARGVHIQVD